MSDILIYAAYGYSGRRIAEAMAKKGLRPVVAGRDPVRTASVGRVLGGEAKPGFRTPGGLYGADLVLAIAGSERRDLW